MSVLIETTMGALVVDLYVDACPLAATNFLKLCKTKYYHDVLFFNVQEHFMVQTGDPTGTGRGGESIYGQLYGAQARFFENEIRPELSHTRKGLVGMAHGASTATGASSSSSGGGGNHAVQNGSQFYITTRAEDMTYLDGKYTIFGEIAEGMDVLDKIDGVYVDEDSRPYQDVRIRHTYVLDDPFPDPPQLQVPPESPRHAHRRPPQETVDIRLAAADEVDPEEDGEDARQRPRTEEEIEASLREKEAKSRAVVLEMIGDLPDADVKPPEEVLFVCKLNPVTESADLDMAFCRFGPCKSEVIRDTKTGDSLCFAFIEFEEKAHCEEAFFKMNNVLLDDRRIKVDFSQSVSKLWNKVTRRPWEARSKGDADGQGDTGKRNGSGRGQGGEARHRLGAGVGKNLRLKQAPRRAGDAYELLSDGEQEKTRKPPPPSVARGQREHRQRDHGEKRGPDARQGREEARSRRDVDSDHRNRSRSRSRSPYSERKKRRQEHRDGRGDDDRQRGRHHRERSRDRDHGRDSHGHSRGHDSSSLRSRRSRSRSSHSRTRHGKDDRERSRRR